MLEIIHVTSMKLPGFMMIFFFFEIIFKEEIMHVCSLLVPTSLNVQYYSLHTPTLHCTQKQHGQRSCSQDPKAGHSLPNPDLNNKNTAGSNKK